MKTLHVLNGDATLIPFFEANLLGSGESEVVVWREILSEGPVKADPGTDEELWSIRREWLSREPGTEPSDETRPDDYTVKVVDEFNKLSRYAEFDQVVLWFEHDLVCQINLIFLLAYFAEAEPGPTVLKQVSIDKHPEVPAFKGIGQLTGAQLATLHLQAEELGPEELTLARAAWKAYAGPEPMAVQALLSENFHRLRFLRQALTHHLQRFPFADNGLNLIERQLTSILMEGPLPESELIGRFLTQDRLFGIGDRNVEQLIRQLDGLVHRENRAVQLTNEGVDTLAGRRAFAPVDRWLGGYHQTVRSRYRWDAEMGMLV